MIRNRHLLSLLPLAALSLSSTLAAQHTDLLVPGWFSDDVQSYDATTGLSTGRFDSGGTLNAPHSITTGPDGHVYVTSNSTSRVNRYDGVSGAFIDNFAIVTGPTDADFGPDGNLYVTSFGADTVRRYDGTTGAFIDVFIPAGSGGLDGPEFLDWGPDGNLYVASGRGNSILRYNAQTGAFIDVFVTPGDGGLNDPHGFLFGPDGNLFAASFGTNPILEFDRVTGAFVGPFVSSGPDAPSQPHGIRIGLDGLLYVASFGSDEVRRYDGTTGAFVDAFVMAGAGGINAPIDILLRREPQLKLIGPLPGTAGVTNSVTCYKADPGETVAFAFGTINGALPIGLCGLSVFILNPVSLAVATADPLGVATINVPVPTSVSGVEILLQTLSIPTCRASNVVRYQFP